MERIPVISPHWTSLHRIEVALATLQQTGTDFDDRARAAVNAVLAPPPAPPPPPRAGTNPKAMRRAALQSVFNDLLRREPPAPTASELIAALEADAARHR
jgi:hypothetical protein